MRNLRGIWKRHVTDFAVWMGVSAAVVSILAVAAMAPRVASADDFEQPDAPLAVCLEDSHVLVWTTENDGQAEAPEGWKVERRHWDSGRWVVRTFTFIGDEADALLSVGRESWLWDDEIVDRNAPYTYRFRAINADGSDTAGRSWSPYARADCLLGEDDQPRISLPECQAGGLAMLWRPNGLIEAPAGWKVERMHREQEETEQEGTEVVQTFTFIGADADALLIADDRYWEWVDTNIDLNVDYTYRVRAVNADASDTNDRVWSRVVSGSCQHGLLYGPGISVPQCLCDKIGIFWHTQERGAASAPEGWKVERRHRDSGEWVTDTFTFIGSDADALQTYNESYWDWFDESFEPGVAYTYRVRAIHADGSDVGGRSWSRRAPVDCDAMG